MTEKTSPDYGALKIRAKELAKGPEDRPVIEARLKKLTSLDFHLLRPVLISITSMSRQ